MLNRRQRETLQAIEEQLLRDDPALGDRFAGRRPGFRHWGTVLAVAVLLLVASVVVGYTGGALLAGGATAVATWRLRARRRSGPSGLHHP